MVIPLTLFLGSCGADFASVKKFGDTRETVKKYSDEFAEDIYQSCLRRARFVNLVPPNGIDTQKKILESCETVAKLDSKKFKKAVSVLIDYMAALSYIAGGEGLSLDDSIDNLESTIKTLSINGKSLDANAVDGGSKILKVLFALLTKKMREDALQKAIVCTNEPIHQYITGNSVPETDKDGIAQYKPATGGLIFLVEEGYINGTLRIEEEAIYTYYQPYFTFLNELGNERNAIDKNSYYGQIINRIKVGETLTLDYNKAIDKVSEQRKAAITFSEFLLTTVKTHNKLRKEFEEGLALKEINELCQFNQKISFKEIEPKKLKRIQKILNEYVTSIKPLVEQVVRDF